MVARQDAACPPTLPIPEQALPYRGQATQHTRKAFVQIERNMCTAVHFVRRPWSETERKLTLPRLSCDTITIAQSIDKMIAKCSENGHPEPSGFTEPVGRAWILWKDGLGTLGSRILIVSPVRCSLLIVEKCNKSGRYLASKEVLRNICIATSATKMEACLEWKPKTQDPSIPIND